MIPFEEIIQLLIINDVVERSKKPLYVVASEKTFLLRVKTLKCNIEILVPVSNKVSVNKQNNRTQQEYE